MKEGDNIAAHVSKVENVPHRLCDLGEVVPDFMQITKVLCSLVPSYTVVRCAWDNLPKDQQTMHALIVQLLKHDSTIKLQNGNRVPEGDDAYFSSSGSSERNTELKAKSMKKRDNDYIKELKKRTKCNHGKELGHWVVECPNKDKIMENKQKDKTDCRRH
jgi:hypothetical protein